MVKIRLTKKNPMYLFYPFNREVAPGEIIEVTKKQADSLILVGFEYVKQETKKRKGGK